MIANVFDRFPNGILVCERGGGIVAANVRACELLSLPPTESAGQYTCCTLIGCRRRDGLLGGRCVCEQALVTPGGMPERRVVRPDGGVLWVRAAPLGGASAHVVVELRAERGVAEPDDRPRLRIFALGRLRVECGGEELTGDWVDRRAGQLLRCLVCERHRVVPTEVLAEAIWREPGPSAPKTVRHVMRALRDRIEPCCSRHGDSTFVVSHRGGYALDREHVWIDVDEFEADVAAGQRALVAGDGAEARVHFERATSAYAGDFLSDDLYAEFAMPERERVRGLHASTLRHLADLNRHDPESACRYLEQLALLEPFDDDTARALISAWMRLGRRSRAVRLYRAFQVRLLREFGEEPDFGIDELVRASREPPAAVGRDAARPVPARQASSRRWARAGRAGASAAATMRARAGWDYAGLDGALDRS